MEVLTILLIVGMKVIYDLTHTVEREVIGIESEDPSLFHVV